MNENFWGRLDRLEELAGKIPVVEWYHLTVGKDCHAVISKEAVIATACLDEDDTKTGLGVGDKTSDYIAAANPAMILEMASELKKHWDRAAEYAQYADYLATYIGLYDGLSEPKPSMREIYGAVFDRLRELKFENQRLKEVVGKETVGDY